MWHSEPKLGHPSKRRAEVSEGHETVAVTISSTPVFSEKLAETVKAVPFAAVTVWATSSAPAPSISTMTTEQPSSVHLDLVETGGGSESPKLNEKARCSE